MFLLYGKQQTERRDSQDKYGRNQTARQDGRNNETDSQLRRIEGSVSPGPA
jgi:hypothetical protein